MSLRYEQYNSLRATKDFLRDLLDPRKTERIPRDIRKRAYRCLRHYPHLYENGQPMFSADPFTEDKQDRVIRPLKPKPIKKLT